MRLLGQLALGLAGHDGAAVVRPHDLALSGGNVGLDATSASGLQRARHRLQPCIRLNDLLSCTSAAAATHKRCSDAHGRGVKHANSKTRSAWYSKTHVGVPPRQRLLRDGSTTLPAYIRAVVSTNNTLSPPLRPAMGTEQRAGLQTATTTGNCHVADRANRQTTTGGARLSPASTTHQLSERLILLAVLRSSSDGGQVAVDGGDVRAGVCVLRVQHPSQQEWSTRAVAQSAFTPFFSPHDTCGADMASYNMPHGGHFSRLKVPRLSGQRAGPCRGWADKPFQL